MDKLIEYLVNQIRNKDINGIIPLISIIILTLIFISPSSVFILFCKRSMFLDYSLSTNIMIIFILDILLFLVLFVIGSLRDIEFDSNFNPSDKGKTSKDIIMTIVLMGLVSIVITLVCSIFLVEGWNVNITIGIEIISITLVIIFFNYICKILIKFSSVVLKKNKGKHVLNRIFQVIVGCIILMVVIIKEILKVTWNMIFNGKA